MDENRGNNQTNVRAREKYAVNFARTNAYQNSAIPYCQRLLNKREETKKKEEKVPSATPSLNNDSCGAGGPEDDQEVEDNIPDIECPEGC